MELEQSPPGPPFEHRMAFFNTIIGAMRDAQDELEQDGLGPDLVAQLDGETDRLTRRAIRSALEGDTVALRLCLEGILPPIKSRPIRFKLPTLRTVSDALSAITQIIDGAASGEILADEAQSLTDMVSVFIKALEVNSLEDRLAALEKASAPPEGRAYDA